MKKHFYAIATIAILSIGCEKEQLLNKPSSLLDKDNVTSSELSILGNPTQLVTMEEGMLRFLTVEHFLATETYLRTTTEAWDDSFLALYGHLNDEDLNSKEAEIGHNDEQPLENFENLLGFNSLRKKIFNEELIWLENDDLDINSDPDNHYIVDEVIRSLLNENAEVKIGKSIFVMREEATAQIIDGSLETLEKVRNTDDVRTLVDRNVKVIEQAIGAGGGVGIGGGPSGGGGTGGGSSDCDAKGLKRDSDYAKNSNGDRRIKWVVSVWTYPWGCGPIAKTKSYKKKRKGWKKYRTDLYARVAGQMVNDKDDCKKYDIYAEKSKKAKKVKTARVGNLCKTENKLIYGLHIGAGVSYSSELTF